MKNMQRILERALKKTQKHEYYIKTLPDHLAARIKN